MHVRENTDIMGAGLGDAERRQMPGGSGPPSPPPSFFCGLSKGAAVDLPARYSHPKSFVSWCTLSLLGRCLVNRSAGLTSPRTFRTSIAPVRTFSCTHSVWVSRCLSLPSPDRVEIPSAALESVQTRTGVCSPKSFIMDWCPRPAPAALTNP